MTVGCGHLLTQWMPAGNRYGQGQQRGSFRYSQRAGRDLWSSHGLALVLKARLEAAFLALLAVGLVSLTLLHRPTVGQSSCL